VKVTRGDRIHAGVMTLSGILTMAAWALYWTTDFFLKPGDPLWTKFENPFVLPDAAMSAALWTSAWWMIKGDRRSVPIGIAAGGAATFLFLLDFLFNLQNGYYVPVTADVLVECIFNLVCAVLGPVTVIRLWRRLPAFETSR
jgi:hypothetical protein